MKCLTGATEGHRYVFSLVGLGTLISASLGSSDAPAFLWLYFPLCSCWASEGKRLCLTKQVPGSWESLMEKEGQSPETGGQALTPFLPEPHTFPAAWEASPCWQRQPTADPKVSPESYRWFKITQTRCCHLKPASFAGHSLCSPALGALTNVTAHTNCKSKTVQRVEPLSLLKETRGIWCSSRANPEWQTWSQHSHESQLGRLCTTVTASTTLPLFQQGRTWEADLAPGKAQSLLHNLPNSRFQATEHATCNNLLTAWARTFTLEVTVHLFSLRRLLPSS